jgi:hypothetical protein
MEICVVVVRQCNDRGGVHVHRRISHTDDDRSFTFIRIVYRPWSPQIYDGVLRVGYHS